MRRTQERQRERANKQASAPPPRAPRVKRVLREKRESLVLLELSTSVKFSSSSVWTYAKTELPAPWL